MRAPDVGSPPALVVQDLHAWYGESHVLHGVDMTVSQGECVALLGRNGAGRTTTLRAVFGLVGRRSGVVRVNGRDTEGRHTFEIARFGVAYCPEHRGIFSNLSCEENLLLPPTHAEGADRSMSLEQIYDMFPNLRTRRRARGSVLSGGEKQMLALARILRGGARLLLLDEISEGLAPQIVDQLKEAISELARKGYTILLVEQNLSFASELCDRMFFMEQGKIINEISRDELDSEMEQITRLLSI